MLMRFLLHKNLAQSFFPSCHHPRLLRTTTISVTGAYLSSPPPPPCRPFARRRTSRTGSRWQPHVKRPYMSVYQIVGRLFVCRASWHDGLVDARASSRSEDPSVVGSKRVVCCGRSQLALRRSSSGDFCAFYYIFVALCPLRSFTDYPCSDLKTESRK